MKFEQVPPVAAHGLVTNALLARDRGGGHRLEQLQAPIDRDRGGRDGAVAEVDHIDVAAVRADRRPADLTAGIID